MKILGMAIPRLTHLRHLSRATTGYRSPQHLLLSIHVSAAIGIFLADELFTFFGYGMQETEAKPWILLGLWMIGVKFLMANRSADRKEMRFRIW